MTNKPLLAPYYYNWKMFYLTEKEHLLSKAEIA